MRIGINVSGFLLKDDEWNNMVRMLFQHIARNWPQHHFFLITDDIQKVTPFSTITSLAVSNPLNNRLSLKLWYDYKLPSILKKNKIDVFINPDGVCSLRSHIPQIVLVKDFFSKSFTKAKNKGFIKRRFQKSLVKANTIIIFNPADKLKLLDKFPLANEKIIAANLFANSAFQPKDWAEKEQTKDKYSEGKEYFFYKIDEHNPIDPLVLLKAFSLFKKRQQSNMQLILLGGINKFTNNLMAKMANYKYRNEVKMLNLSSTTDVADVLASAYALLYFSTIEIDLPLLNAFQVGVPVIVLRTDFSNTITNDTISYADANSAESIAEQMKIIYKDENLRSRIIAAGTAVTQNRTVEKTAAQIWPAISK